MKASSEQVFATMSLRAPRNATSLSESALTLEALLELPDKLFVTAAYQAVLGRAPDQGGLENYVSQVRTGIDKVRILSELARSPEGRMKSREVFGLSEAIAESCKRAPSIWRRLYRRLAGADIGSTERNLRIIDNRLRLTEQALAKQAEELADLRALALKLLANSGSSDPFNPALDNHVAALSHVATRSDSISQLSPNVARIFLELKAAIAMKREK
jgi:hypothetical protein